MAADEHRVALCAITPIQLNPPVSYGSSAQLTLIIGPVDPTQLADTASLKARAAE
jgi:hypothetical protein